MSAAGDAQGAQQQQQQWKELSFPFFYYLLQPQLPEQSPPPALQGCIPVSLCDPLVSHSKLWGVPVLQQRHPVPIPQTGLRAENRDMLGVVHSANTEIHLLDEGVCVLESAFSWDVF